MTRSEPWSIGITLDDLVRWREVHDVADSNSEAWDLFGPVESPDALRTWIAFGLTIGACAVAGLGLGVLIASAIGKKVWETVTGS